MINLRISILCIALIISGCTNYRNYRDPYSSQRLSPAQIAAHNTRILGTAPASPSRTPVYGFPPGVHPGSGRGYQIVYNPFSDRWVYARTDASPRYNPMEDRWEIARESDELKYNAIEDYYQYVPPNADVQYNAMEDRFQFTNPDDGLKYNAMEDRWEYAPANSSLRYNAMEDTWQYVPDE